MNVLVCPNTLIVGGASLLAVDLAAGLRGRGHRMVVFGPEERLVDRFAALDLEWIEGPPVSGTWPAARTASRLRRIVADEGIDLVHTYEWPRCLEAAFGPHALDGVPLVSSIMSVRAPRYLPRSAQFVVGTRDLERTMRGEGIPHVALMEPVLDDGHAPTSAELAAFRAEHGLDDGLPLAVLTARLEGGKVEGVEHAIDAVGLLDDRLRIRLLVVGDGEGAHGLWRRATALNRRLGRDAVVFTGLLLDVAPSNASADVVLGMGTSVLRGMAAGKPAIVVGREGFSELVTETTAPALNDAGFWGWGPSAGAVERLAGLLEQALGPAASRVELAAASRAAVAVRPTREGSLDRLELLYGEAVRRPRSRAGFATASARTLGHFAGMRARTRAVRAGAGLRRRPQRRS